MCGCRKGKASKSIASSGSQQLKGLSPANPVIIEDETPSSGS